MNEWTEMALQDVQESGISAVEDMLEEIGLNMGRHSAEYRAYERGLIMSRRNRGK